MIKIIQVIIIISIMTSTAVSQYIPDPYKNPLKIEQLEKKNKAKIEAEKIKSKKIKLITEISTSSYSWYYYTEYDKNGNRIIYNKIDERTQEPVEVNFIYDSQGNVITQNGGTYEIVSRPGEFIYDYNNNLIKETKTDEVTNINNQLVTNIKVSEYKYDSLGNLGEIITTTNDNLGYEHYTDHCKLNYKYENNDLVVTYNLILDDRNDTLSKRIIDFFNGRPPLITKYKFDSNNNIIYKLEQSLDYDEKKYKSNLYTFLYDNENNLLESAIFNFYRERKELEEKFIYNYNINGILTNSYSETNYYQSSSFYDEYGKIIRKETDRLPTESVLDKNMLTYNYDNNGNLILEEFKQTCVEFNFESEEVYTYPCGSSNSYVYEYYE